MPDGLSYQLIRSPRRTLAVEVHPNGEIVVRAPTRTSLTEIEAFLRFRARWLSDKITEIEHRSALVPQRTHERQFYHRGQLLDWGWENADLVVPQRLTSQSEALSWVSKWQRSQAQTLFASMIGDHLPHVGVPGLRYQGLKLRRMKRRWGSCTSTGYITLNEHLIRVPDGCIRGVVVHELCHLAHLNHGPAFGHLMNDLYPDHRLSDVVLDAWTLVLE